MVFRVLRPDSVSVWKNQEIIKRFSRYRGIIDGSQVARYIVAVKPFNVNIILIPQ